MRIILYKEKQINFKQAIKDHSIELARSTVEEIAYNDQDNDYSLLIEQS